MLKEKPNETKLKVQEALQEEAYKGIVRIDSQTMRQIGVRPGDIIEIEGGKITVGVVDRAYPTDIGQSIIRMDGILRRNAKTGIGELVKIRKAEVKEAKSVTIAPAQQGVMIQADPELFKRSLLGRPILKGDIIALGGTKSRRRTMTGSPFEDIFDVFEQGFMGGFGFGSLKFIVADTNPKEPVIITENTSLTVSSKAIEVSEDSKVFDVTYEDIGGLEDEVKKIREMVELPLKHPEIFERLGVEAPKGVLLHGPPGTGKTLLAKAVANETDSNFLLVNGPELTSKFYGESEKRIRDVFQEAEKSAPSIIFIDEIDSIAPKREETYGEVERRMVSQLLTVMDGLKSRGKVVVIGASVIGDTPIMIKDENGIRIIPIKEFVDLYYRENEENIEKAVDNKYTLGFDKKYAQNKFNNLYFDNSNFKKVRSVFRHRVNEIYEIKFKGGIIKTTGNHSVFVRTKQGLKFKPVALLKPGEILVELPYKINSHMQKVQQFPESLNLTLPVHNLQIINQAYELAITTGTVQEIKEFVDKHTSTINRWKRGAVSAPRELNNEYWNVIPHEVQVNKKLMKLFGYYTAEGYARKELDFCFGTHETNLMDDLINTMHDVFKIEPSNVRVVSSRTNITYNIKPLADFFSGHCGKGAKNKHVPGFLFDLPRALFLEFVKAYFAGEGYEFKDGKLQATSISKQLIIELNWLFRMHGIKSHITKFKTKKNRIINNGKPIQNETIGYRINIPKTTNPFLNNIRINYKKARVISIKILPYNDYVYDLCGCDNEAFFGGETPILLHNTNRPNSLDPALRRPGRFDREVSIGVPNKKGRLNILKIHTRNMPFDKDVSLTRLAEITHGFVGADLLALCKEAAMNVLRRILPDINLKEDKEIPQELLNKLLITDEDFKEALKLVRPSALREVLIETPNVKWDQIGGLEYLKQELREAVEWPLKNPEVFTKMGIRAPRGILMYGPPGTGKTLLAKAVASESEANFIYVKGPELISKWVGESLPYDEKLIVKKEGIVQRMKIGDIVENKENVEVLSFDKDKRTNFSKINDYIKHPLTSNLLEVTTRTGRKIRVTSDHSLFSFVNGKFVSLPTNYLIPNESYIAIPKRLNLPRERIEFLNLYESFKEDKGVFVGKVKNYLTKAKLILGLNRASQILGVSKKYLADIIGKDLPISIINFNKLIKEAKLALDYNEIKIKLKGSTHSYPPIFKIDKDFWRLVGLWIAEGDLNGYTVRIHNMNPEIRKDAESICKGYNLTISNGKRCFSINSRLIQKIFKNVLGLTTGAKNKKIPPLAFILDKESKASLLKGYFSGDGSIYSEERGKFKIEAGTISKELANDILYLLLDFGIVATLYKKQERTGSTTYRISILGVKNFENFEEIGFIDRLRNGRIKNYIASRKWFRSDLIPLSGELYKLTSNNIHVGNAVGKERLKNVLMQVDSEKTKYPEYWDLVNGDIFFDLVKEIKILNNEKYVYDISVPNDQNFVAGFGGIFAHNSERGIRKIFEKARQASPTIIFFDEIDSIAARRGGIDEGSRATERVVNQLLTEMDGLEEMAGVVVLAATNRPDMLDPGLLRPGRFDKILSTKVPDARAREEIFRIHTKNMPLTTGVDLKELAKLTENYVGADIEGLCREAALIALRKNMKTKQIGMEDFRDALEKTNPSIQEDELKRYKEIEEEYIRTARAAIQKVPSYLG